MKVNLRTEIAATFIVAACLLPIFSPSVSLAAHKPAQLRTLDIQNAPWVGDFDKMLERRMIRILVPYSRTLYFSDKGREGGITAENIRDFEAFINKKYKKELGDRPITIYILPTTRDKLIPYIVSGMGDIAAGDITVTKERLADVDFVSPPDQRPVNEIVVTGPKSPEISSLYDLSEKTVYVRKSSSYYASLTALNEMFESSGRKPVNIELVPDELEDEDMMEMTSVGLFGIIVVDDWLAEFWSQILPGIELHPDVILRKGGMLGWAVRKGSTKLEQELMDCYAKYAKKHGVIETRFGNYMKKIKKLRDAKEKQEMARFEQTLDMFKKYGAKYNFDPLMLAAQGYQESRLDQNAKGSSGAIGIMQLLPATGKEMAVGDIRQAGANIHAGVKYMDMLMSKYFADAHFSDAARPLFAIASYNAGPAKIAKMRIVAKERGLDPNKWFNNVELVVADKIGEETAIYVRNIYKYYVSYKLIEDAIARADKIKQTEVEKLKD